jgi:hypothetical protein
LLEQWAKERVGAARKKHSADMESQAFKESLRREEGVFKKMAKKERKRVPDGLRDIAVDLLREELHLSARDLDKSHISKLFDRSRGERGDSFLSIWTRSISSESVDACWTEAVRLQSNFEGSGADHDPEDKNNDDLHRTCTTSFKRIIRDDLPPDQQEVAKHLLLQQQDHLTESMADLSFYAQGILMKVGSYSLGGIRIVCFTLPHCKF